MPRELGLLSQAEIHSMVLSEDRNKKEIASAILGDHFSDMPDKEQAWQDLHMLTQDLDEHVRWRAVLALEPAFYHIPNTVLAWQSLRILTADKDIGVRRGATSTLEGVFPLIPDKEQAWQDLMSLTQDDDESVRFMAASALGPAFCCVQNKAQAWNDLQSLTLSEDYLVRRGSIYAFASAFPYIPDKAQAWQDLHKFTFDRDYNDRRFSVIALESAFYFIPDKDQAWDDLQRLTQDQDESVRRVAARALAFAFPQVSNKDQASIDLHRLTKVEDWEVRFGATSALGLAFPYAPDKDLAWKDLQRLIQDGNEYVRCFAYYALGRASIFRATEAENETEFKAQIEEAIKFFETASKEVASLNPASFCLPFYRSLYSLLFTSTSKENEIQNYLEEARQAVEESERREILLQAVENLSKALQEVKSYTVEDMTLNRRDLRAYTRYCFRASECLNVVRENAPLASKIIDSVAVEKSVLILNKKIKVLFKEVEEAAEILCKNSRGSELEELGNSAYKSTKGLSEITSPITAERYLEEVVPLLKAHCDRLPKDAQAYLKDLINSQDTASQEQRFDTLKSVLIASLVQGGNDNRRTKEYEELITFIKGVEFSVSRLSLSSGDSRLKLENIQSKMDTISCQIKVHSLNLEELGSVIEEKDLATIESLEKTKLSLMQAIENKAQGLHGKEEIERILKEVQGLKQSKARDRLGLLGDLYTLVELAKSLIALIMLIPS